MSNKAKHAHGSSENLMSAIESGRINAFDILFLDADTDNPKMGWLDSDGNPIVIDHKADMAVLESELEDEIATKANAEDVKTQLTEAISDTVTTTKSYTDAKVEVAMDDAEHSYEKVKYEITNVPVGTLVDYKDKEIRIMCPENAEYHLQEVGAGGDGNTYYVTLNTYAPNDNCVGYIEHLDGQVDEEILKDLKTDKYGRKFQPTWLGVAKYDSESNTWAYYGANSSESHYIGWDYQIDWYNADEVMIASDSIRINLSNEKCHSAVEPYYIGEAMSEVDEKIAKALKEYSGFEIVEF